jgi:hypothetical protein
VAIIPHRCQLDRVGLDQVESLFVGYSLCDLLVPDFCGMIDGRTGRDMLSGFKLEH